MVFLLLAHAFWLVAPAYAANGFPPLMRGRRAIDRGRVWRGKRLLGDGKTIEGTAGGIAFGMLFAFLQLAIQQRFAAELAFLSLPVMTIALGFALSAGALAGDIAGSFIKRRRGIKRGGSVPLLDQLGFLLVALLFGYAIQPFEPLVAAALIVLTPPIHVLSNIFGYYVRLKMHPW